MYRLAILFCTVYTVLANPIVVKEQDASANYQYGFATRFPLNVSSMSCLAESGFDVVFARVNIPSQGVFDANAITTIRSAYSAGIPTEAYVEPLIFINHTNILPNIFKGLKNNGVKLRSIWIRVTIDIAWSGMIDRNVKLLSDMKNYAKAQGVQVGFITNKFIWEHVTDNTQVFASDRLWYTNTIATGSIGETSTNFDDFESFGGWVSPVIKEFAVAEKICGHNLNRIVYKGDSATLNIAKTNEELTIGGNFH